ncbi:serine hydrolase domain-containing protein [Sphingomicrobium flavum]|uniref:serine hydrolase domain-containing protein n=1 Tax=Sphingomicrobium flavum TaxID=1229164 RepID=UPI0021ADACF0|nr:serine hydrolase domain-containing protein [Sphingomicrobium flavum]
MSIVRLAIAGAALVGAVGLAAVSGGGGGEEEAAAPLTNSATLAIGEAEADAHGIDYARFDRRLQRLMDENGMVGLSVGVVENGHIHFLKGYGETENGSGEMVSPDTVFRWASVSKGVAGVLTAKLADEGRLRLDESIARFSGNLQLPGGAQREARVRDVLSHRLGLWRNAYDDRLEDGADPDQIRRDLMETNLTCQPGTCWSYQNVAFDAVTDVVEKVTGTTYQQAAHDRLFVPLGMTSTSMTRGGLVDQPSWARPHSTGKRVLEVKQPYYSVPAAGGINSNIKDLAIWLQAQMGLFPEVVSPQTLATAHAPIVRTPSENSRLRKFRERVSEPYYGLGWRIYDYEGHTIVGHRGGVDGYRSLILFDPELKTGVVAMWNSNVSKPWGLQYELMDLVYGLEFRDWLELDS